MAARCVLTHTTNNLEFIMKSFLKDAKMVVTGFAGGALMFGVPFVVYEYVRPILHSLY